MSSVYGLAIDVLRRVGFPEEFLDAIARYVEAVCAVVGRERVEEVATSICGSEVSDGHRSLLLVCGALALPGFCRRGGYEVLGEDVCRMVTDLAIAMAMSLPKGVRKGLKARKYLKKVLDRCDEICGRRRKKWLF